MKSGLIASEYLFAYQPISKRLMSALLPTISHKVKQVKTTMNNEVNRLFERAHEETQRILEDIPDRLKYFERMGYTYFAETVAAYRPLYEEFQNNDCLHKLEIITIDFGLSGAVDLLKSDIDLDVLVSYSLLSYQSNRDKLLLSCNIVSGKSSKEPLFITSEIELDNLQNHYEYCISSDGELYWECTSSGSIKVNNTSYWFTVNKRRLNMSEMWREITIMMQQGHELRNSDFEPLTRIQMIHELHKPKL